MKKFILPILAVSIFLPNIVFAAWWNPLTWKVFNKNTESQTEESIPRKFDPVAEGGIPVVPNPNKSTEPVQPTTTYPRVALPSVEQLERLRWYCNNYQSGFAMCNRPGFMDAYKTNPELRNVVDDLSIKARARAEQNAQETFSLFEIQRKRDELRDAINRPSYVPNSGVYCTSEKVGGTIYTNCR